MGRWGHGIYESDDSLDFVAEITAVLIKEAAYWFSPEQVYQGTEWLLEALTIVEIMLIIDEEDYIGLGGLRDQHIAARRWRDVFFTVWDADWDDNSFRTVPYRTNAYRLEHRPIANAVFDRLIEHADDWRDDLPEHHGLQPFALSLPHLSVRHLRDGKGQEFSAPGYFLGKFVDRLLEFIVFTFSEEYSEMRHGLDFPEIERVCVAVDIIGHLCVAYQVPPGLRPATIQRWLDRVISFWIEYYDRPERRVDIETLDENDEQFKNSVEVFVRLMTAAQVYPGGIPR